MRAFAVILRLCLKLVLLAGLAMPATPGLVTSAMAEQGSGGGSGGGNSGGGNSGSNSNSGSANSGSGSPNSGQGNPGNGHGGAKGEPEKADRGEREGREMRGGSPMTGWGGSSQEAARAAVKSGAALPLAAIMPTVMAASPGRVLEIDLIRTQSGEWRYQVLLLGRDWQYRELLIDARGNRVLAMRRR